jgi:hypothetical protein
VLTIISKITETIGRMIAAQIALRALVADVSTAIPR